MKNKSLLIGLGLVSCCGAVAIGISTYVSYKNINARVDAVSNSLNAPSFTPSSVLQENYNYYIYLPLNDIKLGDYSSLPTVNTLIPNYISYSGHDWTIPFYPSLTIDNVSYDKINIEVEFLESTYRYMIYLKSSSPYSSVEVIDCYIMPTDDEIGYYDYTIGFIPNNSTDYEYDLSSLNVFDGSHYIRYVRDSEDITYEPIVRSFLGCFGVSSARDINVLFDYNNPSDFPISYNSSFANNLFYSVNGTSLTSLPFNDFGGTTTIDDKTQKTFVVNPILEGDIFYNGVRYTGLYAVYRTLMDVTAVFNGAPLNLSKEHELIHYTYSTSSAGYSAWEQGVYGLYCYIFGNRSLDSYERVSSVGFYSYVTNNDTYFEDGETVFVYNRNAVKWINNGVYANIQSLKYTNPVNGLFNGLNGSFYITYSIDSYSALLRSCSYVSYNFNPLIIVSNGGDMPTGTLVINSFTLLSGALSGLTGLLSFMILPNITIGMIVAIPFLITILLFIIKLFKR